MGCARFVAAASGGSAHAHPEYFRADDGLEYRA
jgi:hypothetical protein